MKTQYLTLIFLFIISLSVSAAPVGVQVDQIQTEQITFEESVDLTGSTFRLASVASISRPYIKHPDVRHFIKYFRRKPGMRFIRESLERAMPYIPHIMRKLEEYDLPYELIYLPILESGYRLHAVSRAKAVGPWQFMYDSALPYGLVINDWRDDRRDIVSATDAALRKIRNEIRITEDLWLAMAAYNGGLTRVLRVKRELESMGMKGDFWTMLDNEMLPKETMSYIPKFIAISYIIREVIKFSPNALRKNNTDESIVILKSPGKINLVELADNIGVDQFYLTTLNAGLIRGYTPPSSAKKYYLKVPAYSAEAARDYLAQYVPARAPAAPKPPTYRTYVVRRGDTLTAIARRHGVTQSKIIRANPGINPSRIYPGQRLQIP